MAANPLAPIPERDFDYWSAAHLLRRAGFGGTPEVVQTLHAAGLDGAVDRLVEFTPTVDDGDRFDADIMRPRSTEENQVLAKARDRGDEATVERYRQDRQQRQRRDRTQLREIRRWWLERMIKTTQPLEEKMTLFWHGHFATGYRTVEDSWHLMMQNRLFRAHALDDFATLTRSIIRDPAMLQYLDGDQNRKGRPNENLARELMELFVLGEGNGYTEADIREGARALTGFTYVDDAFEFKKDRHDAGLKFILGRRGAFDGDDFVEILLAKPETSIFLCEKLYRFFVDDRPGSPDAEGRKVVEGMAKTFRRSKYRLTPVLGQLFRSRHFHAPERRASIVKSPIQLVVQSIRELGTPTRDDRVLLEATDLMGQNLLQPPSVKGWDGGRSWINTATLFVRQNTLVYQLTGRSPGLDAERDGEAPEPFASERLVDHLSNDGPPDPDLVVDYLLRFTLGTTPHPDRRATVRAFLRDVGDRIDRDRITAMLALITAMPEYQLA
jgi:uncharacterized protein (DUF1800 family)